ncbi:MAG: succinyldiaminopimelate transaminase [Proteobacteria bacterium]|nr:succinyldiaminopimelate transaminase [Pseudomonadota bacterium]NOG59796.1 succinyldiaminopimelate transaminase [Pseudomonadota bacterium]
MNSGLKNLHAYPFERFAKLIEGTTPADKSAISLAIGEPKHPTPDFILETLKSNLSDIAIYPTTRGLDELRNSIANWLRQRFNLSQASLDADKNVLPVTGTREALFAIAQTIIGEQSKDPIVILPNPFYQIYEGAALLAGAEPYYLNCTEENKFIPDFSSVPEHIWQRCQLIYLCSPGNPTGAVVNQDHVKQLLELAEKYDFVIASDECYSEIYINEEEPPVGLLECASNLGNSEYERCLVFHSLSKRSNVPGLRSGFVAGDSELIASFLKYRTYHGCAMPLHVQKASIAAWSDEGHVKENRDKYREKFSRFCDILNPVLKMTPPSASFYLWPKLPDSDTDFARKLYTSENIKVLPGSFLSRDTNDVNPGENRIRIALVAEVEECVEAANRIKQFIESNY